MFGDVLEKKQNENTPFNPQSPYAIAKTFGHYLINNYRSSYGIFCVSGILFNHESPLRGQEFVTKKITTGIARLINGDLKCLELGNIYAKRDWGYAKEYVELMWKMLQKNKPEDFVVSTGESHSIKEFVNVAMKVAGMKTKWVDKGLNERLVDIKNKRVIIKINKKFFRPTEVNYLRGDSSKAKKLLKWKPKTTFKKLVKKMVEFDLKNYSMLKLN
jgi:GDPmannose 4,6-dehydratase